AGETHAGTGPVPPRTFPREGFRATDVRYRCGGDSDGRPLRRHSQGCVCTHLKVVNGFRSNPSLEWWFGLQSPFGCSRWKSHPTRTGSGPYLRGLEQAIRAQSRPSRYQTVWLHRERRRRSPFALLLCIVQTCWRAIIRRGGDEGKEKGLAHRLEGGTLFP